MASLVTSGCLKAGSSRNSLACSGVVKRETPRFWANVELVYMQYFSVVFCSRRHFGLCDHGESPLAVSADFSTSAGLSAALWMLSSKFLRPRSRLCGPPVHIGFHEFESRSGKPQNPRSRFSEDCRAKVVAAIESAQGRRRDRIFGDVGLGTRAQICLLGK